jgi:hypothetical protein
VRVFSKNFRLRLLGLSASAVWVRFISPIYAREIGQAATLLYALGQIPLTQIYCGNYAAAAAHADEVSPLADEKGALIWKAHGMLTQGWLFALTDKAADAVHMVTSAISAWRLTGTTVFTPLYLSYLSSAHAELGQLR